MTQTFDYVQDSRDFSAELETSRYFDAKSFKSKTVQIIATRQTVMGDLGFWLEQLGFQVSHSPNLKNCFECISIDPEECGMICIVLDQQDTRAELESYFRLFKLIGANIPILIIQQNGIEIDGSRPWSSAAKCTVNYPRSVSQLSKSIGVAIYASISWTKEYREVQYSSLQLTRS